MLCWGSFTTNYWISFDGIIHSSLLIIIMIAILHHPATARDASTCVCAIKTVIFFYSSCFSSLCFAAALCVSMWCELFWACCGSSLHCYVCCVSFRALWKKNNWLWCLSVFVGASLSSLRSSIGEKHYTFLFNDAQFKLNSRSVDNCLVLAVGIIL